MSLPSLPSLSGVHALRNCAELSGEWWLMPRFLVGGEGEERWLKRFELGERTMCAPRLQISLQPLSTVDRALSQKSLLPGGFDPTFRAKKPATGLYPHTKKNRGVAVLAVAGRSHSPFCVLTSVASTCLPATEGATRS